MTFEPKLETHILFDSHKTFKIGGFYFLITISSISFKNWCSKKKKNWCSTKPIFIYNANLLGVNFKQTFLSSSQSSLLSISPPHTASHIHLAPSTVFGHLRLNSIHPLPNQGLAIMWLCGSINPRPYEDSAVFYAFDYKLFHVLPVEVGLTYIIYLCNMNLANWNKR